MLHSIVSWDCSFRNFFHLVPSLAAQDFDKSEYEVIYVEQRSKKEADHFNHQYGLQSLSDLADFYSGKMNFRVVYLNEPADTCYHLSKLNNKGIAEAQGDIISVMDGDMLLSKNFLTALTEFHAEQHRVVNLDRRMCAYPVGVWRFSDWKKALIDFDQCLNASEQKNSIVPKTVGNKGPLISARKEYWHVTGGYDEHPVFATSASKAGGDVDARLSIACGCPAEALPDQFGVHPWHPIGYARQNRLERGEDVLNYLKLQQRLIDHSLEKQQASLSERVLATDEIIGDKDLDLIHKIQREEQAVMASGEVSVDRSVYRYCRAVYDTWWKTSGKRSVQNTWRAAAARSPLARMGSQ